MINEDAGSVRAPGSFLALVISGLIVGASSFGWLLLLGCAAAVYSSLPLGHLTVGLGFLQRCSTRRSRRPAAGRRANIPASWDTLPLPGLDVDSETAGESRTELERHAELLEASAPPREIEARRHALIARATYDSS